MKKYTITETPNGWALDEESGDSIFPTTIKPTSRLIIARLMQLMGVGPLSPQVEPETIILHDEVLK